MRTPMLGEWVVRGFNHTRRGRRLRLPLILAAAVVATGLSACSTQPGDIYRTVKLPEDNSILIGARQRIILNSPVGKGSRPGLVNPDRVVCAEPSPDVALAVAQSLGVGISIFGGGGQGALSGSGATAEGVAQLGERTQAIQLLRDQMYRACEAYANGAITGTTYNLIMSKNNDAMVTLMMAGVAGGEFGRAGAAIGGSSSSESSASVSSLLDVTQAADQAADELKQAEKQETAADDNLKAKETIAADTEGKSGDQVEKEEAAVEDAETEAATAKENVKEKQEAKNDADSKARAEITKVIGTGSINANVSVGTAQVLERMQDNFLREDFADEYVSACIVEMGLANAGAPEYLRRLARAEAAAHAHITDKFVVADPESHAARANAYVDYLQEIGTTERYSLLARHCEQSLFEFVVLARNDEALLEREKIRLDAQRIENEGNTTRKETLGLYKELISECNKIGDPDSKGRCTKAATTIIEEPSGQIELGVITTIEIPADQPPLPVVDFDRADSEEAEFDKQKEALAATALPKLDITKVSAEDAKMLSPILDQVTNDDQQVKQEISSLESKINEQLDPSKRAALEAEQNKRPGLLTAVALSADKSEEEKAIALNTLKLHDKNLAQSVVSYRALSEELEIGTRRIEAHLENIDTLTKAIDDAVKKKAAGG